MGHQASNQNIKNHFFSSSVSGNVAWFDFNLLPMFEIFFMDGGSKTWTHPLFGSASYKPALVFNINSATVGGLQINKKNNQLNGACG